MKTIIIGGFDIDKEDKVLISSENTLMKAVFAVRSGELVAFPTETVYGLGANALIPEAIDKIYQAKGRPSDNPLIVHVSEPSDIRPLVEEIPEYAELLIRKFMPGPITLVFNKSGLIPYEVTAGLDTVAVRIPSHPVARAFLALAGVPVAAPSANISGKPSPTSVSHVIEDFAGKIPYIIDGGDCEIGLESSVIDVTGDLPVILRPGAVSEQDILSCCKSTGDFQYSGERPRSPGMKYRHYAPAAKVIPAGPFRSPEEAAGSISKILTDAGNRSAKYGVFAGDKTLEILRERGMDFFAFSYGIDGDIKAAAAGLFRALRDSDKHDLDTVIVEAHPENGIGKAYMNRLGKAAGSGYLTKEKDVNVLFVCTGNTCRSPIAEYYLNNSLPKAGDRIIRATSAGIGTVNGLMASEGAVKAMKTLFGIDISSHRSSVINKKDIEKSALVITMTGRQKKVLSETFPEFSNKIQTLYGYTTGIEKDISDPYGSSEEVYEDTAKEITGLIEELIKKVRSSVE